MTITQTPSAYVISFNYTPYLKDAVKRLPGHRWNQADKTWTVPLHARHMVEAFAQRYKFRFSQTDTTPENYNDIPELPDLDFDLSSLNLKREPYDFQRKGIAYILKNKKVIVGDDMGLGKCQPMFCKVLTREGFKFMRDILPGDSVAQSDGLFGRVTHIFPQGPKEIFLITFSDGSFTYSTGCHLWQVQTPVRKKRGSNPLIFTLHEIIKSGIKERNGNRKYYIPVCDPIQHNHKFFVIDPYLMGVLLGDGGLAKPSSVRITSADKEIIDNVKSVLPPECEINQESKIEFNIRSKGKRFESNPITLALRKYWLMGLKSGMKFIPEIYLRSSVLQRISLLRGLMDTDGWVSRDGAIVQYTTVSPYLKDGFVDLVNGLGGIAKVSSKQPKINGKSYGQIAYTISINLPKKINPFSLSRKAKLFKENYKYLPVRGIEKIESCGMDYCQCIKVSAKDSLYITDHHIVTHNTGQAIVAAALSGQLKKGPALIICPSSLKMNWQREIEIWTNYKGLILDDKTRYNWHRYFETDLCQFIIVNYESLKKYFVKEIDKVKRVSLKNVHFWESIKLFSLVIVDESHRVKTFGTQQTRYTAGICIGKEWVFALTGTPVLNKPSELCPQLGIINQLQHFGGYKGFVDRYCAGQRQASNLKELNYKLNLHCFYRRKKTEVLKDLPAKTRTIIYCDISTRHEYAQAEADLANYMAQFKGKTPAEIDKSMKGEIMVRIGILKNISARGKIAAVTEWLHDIIASGEKVSIWAQLHEVMDCLYKEFPGALKITGRESLADRQYSVDQFQNNPDEKLIACGIQAAGVGITLTAGSTCGFIELGWHSGIMDQCEDRHHRIGQKDNVGCYYFLGKNTIDEWCYSVIESKREITDQITGNVNDVEQNIVDNFINLFNQK